MPNPSLDDASGAHGHARATADFNLALVVGSSPVNRIVVARIAERAGLKVLAETPDSAGVALATRLPGTVILDGGADNRECERLMESLAAQRLAAGGKAPFVILLSNTNPEPGQPPKGGTIDAIVAKPITPDRLQPLIRSMMDRMRD